MRWKLTFEYDGTGFCGWQRQKEGLTVQRVAEEALYAFTGESAELFVAGRTDTGVHAAGQVAHVDLEKDLTARELIGAINFHMRPHKVVVWRAERVSETFHARFSALARSYRYFIYNRPAPSVLLENRVWHVARTLDATRMQEAGNLLLGRHDFSTFRAAGCQAKSPLKTLDELTVTRAGDLIEIRTRAKSFLYHQVRNMVGSLALVGDGRWDLETFANALEAKDRTKGGPTAPPQGLTFLEVTYPAPATPPEA